MVCWQIDYECIPKRPAGVEQGMTEKREFDAVDRREEPWRFERRELMGIPLDEGSRGR